MKLYSFLILCLIATTAHAQVLDKTVFNVAYRYTGRNIIQGGLSYRINSSAKKSFVVGTSILYTPIESKAQFLPEANFYYVNRDGYLFDLSLNPYSIEPRLGISLFNFIYLNTGYALPIHREKYFKGLTFGVQFNIAPVKNSDFYERMRIVQ
ncbi:hypothetical protein [Chryseobacterium sp. OSA05B]|uniref:hypothetical protein n=1 Tax=Chryseobacterium sp. OSA05B TaxID=2862650 RepID=UPI001CBBC3E6|nr:hypothetical protein [Chryseobacterium sp. OSA05B]